MIENPSEIHLVREWEQAWNHYRHLESSRNQYLGYYFTVLLASLSVSISLLRDVSTDEKSTVIFGLLVLVFIVFLITTVLFVSIKKSGYVLKNYKKIINSVRIDSFFRSSEAFPFNSSDMRGRPKVVLESDLFSVQVSAEFILGIGSFLLLLLIIWITVFIFKSSCVFGKYQKGIGIGIVLFSVAYAIAVFVQLIFCINYKRDKG